VTPCNARAGLPATVVPASTSFATSAPAPIIAPAPMRSPPRITAPDPIVAPLYGRAAELPVGLCLELAGGVVEARIA
jgi:hypothetical protein